jgi:hypothetical protein
VKAKARETDAQMHKQLEQMHQQAHNSGLKRKTRISLIFTRL